MEMEEDTETGKNGHGLDATRPCPECSLGVPKADCPLCQGSGWVSSLVLRAYLEYMQSDRRMA